MPSTPQLQRLQAEPDRQSHNGLVPATGLPMQSKSPIRSIKSDSNGFPLASLTGSIPYNDSIDREEVAARMNAPTASTSQLPISAAAEKGINVKQEDLGKVGPGGTTGGQQFHALFKTRRTRAWEKSRKVDEEEVSITLEELMEQLRPEEESLVPLNAMAGRLVLYAWQLFANQVEINPSISPLKRRKPIYYDAHEARKQLIKLLVLVQWSKVAPELNLARSLIAFINDHFVQTDAAVTSLTETRSILTRARLRKYDLATAIEVLSTGSPQRIPPILWETAKSQKRFSDKEAISIVKRLDETIRLRLASQEVVPLALASYTVSDGKALFQVPRLFEAEVTLSGDQDDDRWWMLKVKFDFTVTGTGVDRFPRHLKKQQRVQLLSMADIELAPRSVAAIAEKEAEVKIGDENDTQMKEIDEPLSRDQGQRVERKDAPLVRLYNFLQSQALHYRLDILHYQIIQLKKLDWGDSLSTRMEVIDSTRVLHIAYWQQSSIVVEKAWMPTSSGHLKISIRAEKGERDYESVMEHLSMAGVEDDDDEYRRGQSAERLEMSIEWDVSGPSEEFIASTKLTINPHELDVTLLMSTVTQRHATAALQATKKHLLASSLKSTLSIDDVTRFDMEGHKEPCLLLQLCEQAKMIVRIDCKLGRIRLEEDSDSSTDNMHTSNGRWRKRLQEATSRINEKSDLIVQILYTIRIGAILEDLEEKCHLLGIPITTRMPLRQIDYNTIQARLGTILYLTLNQCPGYHLLIHVGEESIRIGLINVGTFLEDLNTSMRIISLEWLDWQLVLRLSTSTSQSLLGKRKRVEEGTRLIGKQSISSVDLSKIYSYSIALICYHKIEQQLQARNVHYIHIGVANATRSPPQMNPKVDSESSIERIIPCLCLDAGSLFPSTSKGKFELKCNIHIQLCDWNVPTKTHVVFSVKLMHPFNSASGASVLERPQEKLDFDDDRKVLSFSYRDVAHCIELFTNSWNHITKILNLSREVMNAKQEYNFFSNVECDFLQVGFDYRETCSARIRWNYNENTTKADSFHLSFQSNSSKKEDNPHQIIQSWLNSWLNKVINQSTFQWKALLDILHHTFYILHNLYQVSKDSNQKIECPELQVQNLNHFNLIFWDRFRLTIQVIKGNKILFCDSTSDQLSLHGKQDAQSQVKDEFTLDSTIFPSSRFKDGKDATDRIPNLSVILSNLHGQFQKEESFTNSLQSNDKERLPLRQSLVFSNGLICLNDAKILDWIFPRLVQQIQESIDS